MEMAILKDDTEVPAMLVPLVQMGAEYLASSGFAIPLYEAVQLARNPNHILFEKSDEPLRELEWLEAFTHRPRLHQSIAAILRNMAVGEGLDMTFTSPLKG